MWEDRYPRAWSWLERASTVVLGSLLFFLFTLPVITIPAALCGLFRAVRPLATGESGELLRDFWGGFRENLLHGTLFGLAQGVYVGGSFLWVAMLWPQPSLAMRAIAWVFVWVGLFGLMVGLYAWPLLAWYPQPVLKAARRAALLALAHPFWAMAGLLGASVAGLAVTVIWLPLVALAGPGVMALVMAFAAWKGMRRYAPEPEFPTGPDPWEEAGPKAG